MTLIQFLGAFELGMVYSLVALGAYISFRVLNFSDLSVDGTFPLGAAVYASYVAIWGGNPFVAVALAMAAGAFFGWITGWLSTHLRFLNLIAGILTMTALYSINLRIMHNKPLISLLGYDTIFQKAPFVSVPPFVSLFLIIVFVVVLLSLFFKTQCGLALRAVGSNSRMAEAQGISCSRMTHVGLALSNALVALGGAFFAQINNFAEVNMGLGTIIIGFAALIIGEAVCTARTLWHSLALCVVGSILYRCLIAFALNVGDIGLQASDLNLVTAILVACAMMIPSLKRR